MLWTKTNNIVKDFKEEKRIHPYMLNILSFNFKRNNSEYTKVIHC